MVYTNVSGKEGSWVETFGTWYAATSNDPFTSHNAMIFQVPEGTSGFPVRLYNYTKNIYANFWGVWYKNPRWREKRLSNDSSGCACLQRNSKCG